MNEQQTQAVIELIDERINETYSKSQRKILESARQRLEELEVKD